MIKRLAASQGIDVLNLVRSMQEVQQEAQAAQQQQMAMQQQQMQIEAMKTPVMDPSRNGEVAMMEQQAQQQPPQ